MIEDLKKIMNSLDSQLELIKAQRVVMKKITGILERQQAQIDNLQEEIRRLRQN